METEGQKEGALVALLITVSGVSFFGIGSAFWGLIGGLLVSMLLTGSMSTNAFTRRGLNTSQVSSDQKNG
jgi:benzoate membrane transport protein